MAKAGAYAGVHFFSLYKDAVPIKFKPTSKADFEFSTEYSVHDLSFRYLRTHDELYVFSQVGAAICTLLVKFESDSETVILNEIDFYFFED